MRATPLTALVVASLLASSPPLLGPRRRPGEGTGALLVAAQQRGSFFAERTITVESEFCSCPLDSASATCAGSCIPDLRIQLFSGSTVLSQFDCPVRSFECVWPNIPVEADPLNVRVIDRGVEAFIPERVVAVFEGVGTNAGAVTALVRSITTDADPERMTIEVTAATPTPTSPPTAMPTPYATAGVTPTPTVTPTPAVTAAPTPTATPTLVDVNTQDLNANGDLGLEDVNFLNLWRFKSDNATVLVLVSLVGSVFILTVLSVVIDRVRFGRGKKSGKMTDDQTSDRMSYVPRRRPVATLSRIFTGSFSASASVSPRLSFTANSMSSLVGSGLPSRVSSLSASASVSVASHGGFTANSMSSLVGSGLPSRVSSLSASASVASRSSFTAAKGGGSPFPSRLSSLELSTSVASPPTPKTKSIPEERSTAESRQYVPSYAGGRSDRYHGRILLTGLALIDFLGDWLFVMERFRLAGYDAGALSYALAFPPLLPLVFVAVPMAVNIAIVVRVLVIEFRSIMMRDWFHSHSVVGTAVILLSLGHVDALSMLSSRTFGCRRPGAAFNAPLSHRTQQDFFWYGIVGHLLEDVPQICLQVAVITTERSSLITLVAFATSASTLLFGITRRVAFALLVCADRKDRKQQQLNSSSNLVERSVTESNKSLTLPHNVMSVSPSTLSRTSVSPATLPCRAVSPATLPRRSISPPATLPRESVSPATLPRENVSPATLPRRAVSPPTLPRRSITPLSAKGAGSTVPLHSMASSSTPTNASVPPPSLPPPRRPSRTIYRASMV